MRSSVEQIPLLLGPYGLQANCFSQGRPFSMALSIEFSRYPPLQLLPGVHFSRNCSERSMEQIRLLNAFPCKTSELQHMATVVNDQHVPQLPCALTGVTTPSWRQSREEGAANLSLGVAPSEESLILSSSMRCFCAIWMISGGSRRLVLALISYSVSAVNLVMAQYVQFEFISSSTLALQIFSRMAFSASEGQTLPQCCFHQMKGITVKAAASVIDSRSVSISFFIRKCINFEG